MQIEMKIKKELAIEVQGCSVRIEQFQLDEYICITDIAKISSDDNPREIIKSYLRNQNNIEFLTLWERHCNPDFKTVDFDHFQYLRSTRTMFPLSPKKWIELTNAIGFTYKAGRAGGTFTHRDIAIHFTISLSTETYIHLTKELQRLKKAEQNLLNNPTKIPLEEIIAKANRMREEEKDKSEKTVEEKE